MSGTVVLSQSSPDITKQKVSIKKIHIINCTLPYMEFTTVRFLRCPSISMMQTLVKSPSTIFASGHIL